MAALLWYFALEMMLSLSFIQDREALRMLHQAVSLSSWWICDRLVGPQLRNCLLLDCFHDTKNKDVTRAYFGLVMSCHL